MVVSVLMFVSARKRTRSQRFDFPAEAFVRARVMDSAALGYLLEIEVENGPVLWATAHDAFDELIELKESGEPAEMWIAFEGSGSDEVHVIEDSLPIRQTGLTPVKDRPKCYYRYVGSVSRVYTKQQTSSSEAVQVMILSAEIPLYARLTTMRDVQIEKGSVIDAMGYLLVSPVSAL